jgi:hypothetical protein
MSTPISMSMPISMPMPRVQKPPINLEMMMGQLIREMNQLNINLIQVKEPHPFKLQDLSSIIGYICNKLRHYTKNSSKKGSTFEKKPSPKRRVSFEHEKTMNIIEPKSWKIKNIYGIYFMLKSISW